MSDLFLSHEDGMTSTQLGFLDHDARMEGVEIACHQVPAVADYGDHAFRYVTHQGKGIIDKRIAEDLMENLGVVRFQSRAFPGCKDYATSGVHRGVLLP